MPKIFLSWSGQRSQAMAENLYGWLPRVMHIAKPWMSTNDIQKGERWNEELSRSLTGHAIGIICVTPENFTEPWLTFEAGALSHSIGQSKVIPLLLGMLPEELEGPLAHFQIARIEHRDMLRLLRSLNHDIENKIPDEVIKDSFEKYWPELHNRMKAIAKQRISVNHATMSRVIRTPAKHGLDRSNLGYQIYFNDGFESHALYSAVTEIANKRLLVFGRKNRKLFDKNYGKLFEKLKRRVAAGFDFRVMFLDPKSSPEVLFRAHRDDDLSDQIRDCITHAEKIFVLSNLDMQDHCRTYDISRTVSFLVVDNTVLYSTLALDDRGRAQPLTDSRFALVDALSPMGLDLVSNFETLWRLGSPMVGGFGE